MPVRRLITALVDVFRTPEDVSEGLPLANIPPVPVPEDTNVPAGWRRHACLDGPYLRFEVRCPRDWLVHPTGNTDLLHLQPGPREGIDLAVTISTSPEAVAGPQGIVDAVERLAAARGLEWKASAVRLDRWRQTAWAGSWAWRERDAGGRVREWRLLVIGHEQCCVYAMVNGARADVRASSELTERILGSVRLAAPNVLSPEFFAPVLCEYLNQRRATDEAAWQLLDDARIASGPLTVRLQDLYRAYLMRPDLDELAGQLDSRRREAVELKWEGSAWDEVQGHLRVVLRRRESVQALDIVTVALPGGLVACPVLDSDDRMTFIPSQESERWGFDATSLLTRALATLDDEAPCELVELWNDEENRLIGFQLAGGDGYDAGRLLSDRLRSRIQRELGGQLLVAMPAAGQVLVLRDEEANRAMLTDFAKTGYQVRPRPLSQGLWHWTDMGLELLG